MKLKWKWIRNYRNFYKISTLGKIVLVRNIEYFYLNKGLYRTRKFIPKGVIEINLNGDYPRVTLFSSTGTFESIRLHTLMLETFVGPCPPGMEACHKDDNRLNYCISNLYWGTHQQNMKDAIKNGKATIGEKNGQAKFSNTIIKNIRKEVILKGARQNTFCKKFNVSPSVISEIVRGVTYKDAGGPLKSIQQDSDYGKKKNNK